MKFSCKGRLRCRLLILVLMAVVPLAGFMFYIASNQKQQGVDAIEHHVLTMADFAAQEEAQMLDDSREMLVRLSVPLSSRWPEQSECSAYLSELLHQHRRYKNIGLATSNGTIFCSAIPFKEEFDPRSQVWFTQAVSTREFFIGEYQSPGRIDAPMGVLAFPVNGNGDQIIGVAFAILDAQWFNRFNLDIEKKLPNGSIVTQVDERGEILANQPESTAWSGLMVDRTAILEIFRSGSKGTATLQGADGQVWLVAFSEVHSKLRNQKVRLLLAVPQTAVFGEVNRLLAHNLGLLAGVTFLILLVSWFSIDLLVLRQVRAMLTATRKLASGDLNARTGIPRQTGELNELAAAFDNMAEALEDRETQRRKAEQDLRNSREELRNLASHLESVREEERTRLAREIHDELGQAMTALKMDTVWLHRRLDLHQHALHEKTRSMEALIDSTIRAVQRLSGELRPGLLDDLGLAAAIEWQCEEFQKRTGMTCDVLVDIPAAILSREQATALFRVFQETLTNVIRHAQATRVQVRLEAAGGGLVLEVTDNGRGISETETKDPKAFGLIGMRERVLAIKGEFAISGRPSRGTTVTVTLPLENKG